MIVRRGVVAALFLGFAAFGSSVQAQRDLSVAPASEARVALVIGNGAYKNASPLANPPNDARLMAQALSSVGFRLVGAGPLIDAEKPAIERAIRDFGQLLRGGAIGLFYYAGHGVQVKGDNYLIPVSAQIVDETDVKYELVSAGFVLDEMANAGNRLNVLILDACRNNPFGGRGLRSSASGLAQVTAPAGTVISYATQPGNVALDGSGANSPYTSALAAAIRKPGLGVFETFNDVGLSVKGATAGRQQPWLATSPIEGSFQFVPGAAISAAAAPRPQPAAGSVDPAAMELSFWESIKASSNRADFDEYLRQYPQGRFAGLARNRLDRTAAESRETDVSGVWHWSVDSLFVPDRTLTILPDGTCALNTGTKCNWSMHHAAEKRVIIHFDDNWTHAMAVSADGASMTGRDDWGTTVTGRKTASLSAGR